MGIKYIGSLFVFEKQKAMEKCDFRNVWNVGLKIHFPQCGTLIRTFTKR